MQFPLRLRVGRGSIRLRRPTIRCPLWQVVFIGDNTVWINFRVLINRWRAYLWRVCLYINISIVVRL